VGMPLDQLAICVPPFLLAVTFHEAMHGYAAYRLGDPTAKFLGRLTLNPLAHVDLMGSIVIPLFLFITHAPFLFGWAKPVPVDFRNLGNPKRDMIWVAAAGPATNLALAVLSGVTFQVLSLLAPAGQAGVGSEAMVFLMRMAVFSVKINVVLAVFNSIPVPPLDGGRILVGVLPRHQALSVSRLEPYGMFIVVGLMVLDPFGVMTALWRVMGALTRSFLGM